MRSASNLAVKQPLLLPPGEEGSPLLPSKKEDSSYSSEEEAIESPSQDLLSPSAENVIRRRQVNQGRQEVNPDTKAPPETCLSPQTAETPPSAPGGWWHAVKATSQFYLSVVHFLFLGGSYDRCPFFSDSPQAKAQVYSLCVVLWLWDRPHYRSGTYQDDMVANLRNVAIPGSGLPLSLLVQYKVPFRR